MMIIKLIQTPVPDVANCQYFLIKYHWKEANCSIATKRYTTTANTAVSTNDICRQRKLNVLIKNLTNKLDLKDIYESTLERAFKLEKSLCAFRLKYYIVEI